ncbi:MAG TPA: urease accessory protein UreD [Candidatus Binatia bacterium]
MAIDYERRGQRTVLAARRHDGPLAVQKALYPEGDEVCHTIIVHPPGGIAGGDEIDIAIRVRAQGQALLTTPGAGKWYRSAGPRARQRLAFDVEPGAVLEWLPQETIIFNGALAEMDTEVRLCGDGCFIGWEIFCLGRTGSGEKFTQGVCRARTSIQRDGKPLWLERADLSGAAAMMSPAIMAGEPVAGTMVIAGPELVESLLGPCRAAKPRSGAGAVTLLPGLLVGRYLGASSEAAKHYFMQLWQIARPAVSGREAVEPRIWRT